MFWKGKRGRGQDSSLDKAELRHGDDTHPLSIAKKYNWDLIKKQNISASMCTQVLIRAHEQFLGLWGSCPHRLCLPCEILTGPPRVGTTIPPSPGPLGRSSYPLGSLNSVQKAHPFDSHLQDPLSCPICLPILHMCSTHTSFLQEILMDCPLLFLCHSPCYPILVSKVSLISMASSHGLKL